MKRVFSPDEIRKFERRLHALEARASTRAAELEVRNLEETGTERLPLSEEASEQAALQRELQVIALEGEIASKARDALRRIESGAFGICRSCNRPIARARLREIPYAAECSDCAS